MLEQIQGHEVLQFHQQEYNMYNIFWGFLVIINRFLTITREH